MQLLLTIAMVVSMMLAVLTFFGLLGYLTSTVNPSRDQIIKTLRTGITFLNVYLVALLLTVVL